MVAIDHVLFGVQNLQAVARRFEADYGFGSTYGGVHREWGTENRIIPVGETYLELIAVADQASQHPIAQMVRRRTASGDQFIGLCCEVLDIDSTAKRIGSRVINGQRTTPEGDQISFQLTGVEGAITELLPFFIHWRENRHLRLGPAPKHRVQPKKIRSVRLSGNQEKLENWLGRPVDGIDLVGGDAIAIESVEVETSDGSIVIR